jgi:3'-5' exonuclease
LSENVPLVATDDTENVQGYLGVTPSIGQLPARGERFWVERPEQLLNAVTKLKQANVVAVDAEFTQVRTRSQTSGEPTSMIPRLSLLQLAIDRTCFVVDTLRLQNLAPLAVVLSDPHIAILLHGAGGDIRVMAERGLHVVHYYDLEATCRSIFGQHESSLAAMLQRAFAFHLDKSLQRTDWTRRPLPPAMIAYAARDAEVTLALYYWLDRYYHTILQAHEINVVGEQRGMVSPWIEPFLKGNAPLSPEMAVAEARACGLIHNRSQVVTDCCSALSRVTHPMQRSRLLRLIADLGLTQLAPDILLLLQAPTADERAGSVRALGRLGIRSAIGAITPLLHDPVQDVRKAAQTALNNLNNKEVRNQRTVPLKNADGSRRWVMDHEQNGTSAHPADDDNGWKSRLRSIMDV